MSKKFIKFQKLSFVQSLELGKNQRNRKIDKNNLYKIKKQMLESFDVIPPIIVNTITGNVIDGQTRKEAYSQLMAEGKLPKECMLKVMFVEIPEDEEIEAIINANTNSKNWSCDDYFDCYVKGDNVSYIMLKDFCTNHILTYDEKKNKMKFRYAAAMIKGRECQDELKHGSFTCTSDEILHGDMVHSELMDIIDILGLPMKVHWIGSMAISWNKFRDLHPYSEWRKMFKDKRDNVGFVRLPKENVKNWDVVFSTIHSYIDLKKAA